MTVDHIHHLLPSRQSSAHHEVNYKVMGVGGVYVSEKKEIIHFRMRGGGLKMK